MTNYPVDWELKAISFAEEKYLFFPHVPSQERTVETCPLLILMFY
jgi:hypothetical protein